MRRLNHNEIALTQKELDDIQSFIRSALRSDWDGYTSNYICPGVTDEAGMRRMDPEMYDMANEMGTI
jgi:hypothetical protein